MITKLLFLDIDGVLNTPNDIARTSNPNFLHPRNVLQLNRILLETDCNIVITSTWRLYHKMPEIQAMFYEAGIAPGRVIGYTPDIGFDKREEEIQCYIDLTIANEEILKYVILDDLKISNDPNFIHVDGKIGLTESDANKAIQILNSK